MRNPRTRRLERRLPRTVTESTNGAPRSGLRASPQPQSRAAAKRRQPPGTENRALENTIARNRAIAGYAAIGAKLIEVGDHEERLRALEAAQPGRTADEVDAFPGSEG